MFIRRIEIEKKFGSADEANGFVQGIEFIGIREFKVKEKKYNFDNMSFIVVLEKLEKSKV